MSCYAATAFPEAVNPISEELGRDGLPAIARDLDPSSPRSIQSGAHGGPRVVDRRRDRGGDAGQADLADPACAKFVDLLVGEVEEMHLDRRHVGVDRHHVVGQIAVDRRAVLRIVRRVLEQRHADSHHDRALDLVAAGQRVEDAARVDDRHHPADAQPSDLRLPGDLDEVTAERVRRELRLWITERRFGLAVAGDQAQVGARSSIRERHAPRPDHRPSQRPGRLRRPDRRACASRTAIPALSLR